MEISPNIDNAKNGVGAVVPIAICGMALRLPGGLETPKDLWDFLLAKGDARSRVPESRYNISSYHSVSGRPGTVSTEYGYFLADEIGAFDSSYFSLSRAELEGADPQLRLMLEVVRECFDDAGEIDFRGKRIGCYIGFYGEDWLEMQNRDPLQSGPYRVDGYSDFMLSNRVSYEMNIRGPSMTVRTACSSSLVALHQACLAIQRGDCEGAVVGGANLIMAPAMTAFMSEKGVLSPDGSCKTFSSDANGYARAEGINAVFVKPLDAALRDGNPIRAIIRSVVSNSDGKTPGILHPSTDTQETLIRAAYEQAGLRDFSQTAFVECHGTGTAIGDPIEVNAVARVFGDTGVYIGSVKPNLGHSEGASGLTSLMKAVLALENQTIPPNIKFSSPNPKIPFQDRKLTVPLEPIPWPASHHERVSVNSFGIGGTNAHVIVDSVRSTLTNQSALNGHTPGASDDQAVVGMGISNSVPQLLLLSANSASSLKMMKDTFQELVDNKSNGQSASDYHRDLAYTLANRREHLPHRTFMLARNDKSAIVSPGSRSMSKRAHLIMVFTGQGAQWPRMGRELLLHSSLGFRECIRSLDKHLQNANAPFKPSWTLESELLKPPRTSGMQRAELSQPLCTAVQIALVDILRAVGVEPSAVVGHSSGEIAAAYTTGALTAKEAIIVAWQRGVAAEQQTRPGAMAAVSLSWAEVESYLSPNVVVACENSHRSITLSGDAADVHVTIARIQKSHPEALTRILKVNKAYHSCHMREIGAEYRAALQLDVVSKPAQQRFFSSVTGKLEGGPLDAEYWQKNLESPVLFRSAVKKVLSENENVVFLEIGPHPALAGPIRQILAETSSSASYVSTMTRGEDCVESFLMAIGKLFEIHVPVDFRALMSIGKCLSDLPHYPWDHEIKHWKESRMSQEWRFRQFPTHPLLGIRQLEANSLEPSWRNLLHVEKDASWLQDHRVEDKVIMPCASYLAMAGEAMRQLSGVQNSFTLRNVVLSAALVLPDQTHTEVVTNLRPLRLTESLNSEWWEFTISSYNGHIWIKHCDGQVTSEHSQSHGMSPASASPLPRKLESLRYYNHMDKAGLQFGPHFRRLQDARCSVDQNLATANLNNDISGDEEHYHLHPTAIDAVIQSAFFAALKGHADARLYRRIPTKIGKLTIHRCAPQGDMKISTSATLPHKTGDLVGHSHQVFQDGKVILRMENMRLSPLQAIEELKKDMSRHPARLTWSPHIDFQDASSLMQPSLPRHQYTPALDELAQLCMVYSFRLTKDTQTSLPHIRNYKSWLQDQQLCIAEGPHREVLALDNQIVLEKVNSLVQSLSATPVEHCASAMQKIVLSISDIVSGKTEALDTLQADDTLHKMYRSMLSFDTSEFLHHLGHTKPNMTILEIGSGTGASTLKTVEALTLLGRMSHSTYSQYTFTDLSTGLFATAKYTLKGYSNIDYRVLDISKTPSEQGFAGETYDLIIATNVFYATKDLGEALKNVHSLLAPGGRLLLQDLYSSSKWPNLVLGTLPSWWNGGLDGRSDEPYISPSRWEAELRSAGFAPESVVLDDEEPHQLSVIVVAKPQNTTLNENNLVGNKKAITMVCDNSDASCKADNLFQKLQQRGYDVHRCQLGEPLPNSQAVLCVLDYEAPFFENIDETRYTAFQNMIRTLGSSGLMWVARPSHIRCNDPRFAQTIGAARTIRTEMLVDFAICEVDDIDSSLDRIVDVFARFQTREENELLRPDLEYAIDQGIVNVPRLIPFSLQDELTAKPAGSDSNEDRLRLEMATPGRLTTLKWLSCDPKTLSKGDVEVEIHAAGLNFRDVLCALGIVPFPEKGLGLEASGIVSGIGPEVKGIRPGDRVMLLGNGSFATHIVVNERLCVKIPDNLIFEDAATMPVVFATAAYSLFNLGHLRAGQSLLIHSACGGVGLAAIQLAKTVGAEVFATTGSEEKVNFLTNTLGLPTNRIFNSRDNSFIDEVMRETQGKGVDLALNSLSGDLLHATWHCIAEFGTMVEIGKRDLLGAGRLDMDIFLANRTYSCLDLDELRAKRPDVVKELLRSIISLYEDHKITPIRPVRNFDAHSIQDAYRYMQQGQHIGKIVISMRDSRASVQIEKSARVRVPKELQLNRSGSYLLVGGLGGLGRSVSRFLVEHGAQRLLFISRSAGSGPDDVDFMHELQAMGCEVDLIKGSVTDRDDVARAIQKAGPSLRGIMQCTMVLRDVGFPEMTFHDWTAASAPKVRGTWLLHNAVLETGVDLDFFLVFSSLSGTLGTPGQANYAGANTFLDAFVQYRHSLGLAAASINIGAVMDVGVASLDDRLMQRMEQACALGVMEIELLEYISAALASFSAVDQPVPTVDIHGSTKLAATGFVDKHTFIIGLGTTMPLSNPNNRAFHRQDRRMALYHNDTGSSAFQNDDSNSGNGLREFLGRLRATGIEDEGARAMLCSEETTSFLGREIGRKLFAFLLRSEEEDLNTSIPLSQLGMDSLVGVEMRSWWRQAFGFDITVLELLGMGNLDALGRHAAEGIGKMLR